MASRPWSGACCTRPGRCPTARSRRLQEVCREARHAVRMGLRHRRLPGRARPGHHHRRQPYPVPHRQARLRPGRRAGPPRVPAQHDQRRGRRATARSWSSTRPRACATSRAAMATCCTCSASAGRRRGQQDGPGRVPGRALRRDRARVPRRISPASASRRSAVVPVSARDGDNIAARDPAMAWYQRADRRSRRSTASSRIGAAARPAAAPADPGHLQVRRAAHPRRTHRKRPARMSATRCSFSPSNKTARVNSLEAWSTAGAAPSAAAAGQSVGITLDEQIFVERGEVASHVENPPVEPTTVFRARDVLARQGAARGRTQSYRLKLGTRDDAGHGRRRIDRVIDTDTHRRPRTAARSSATASAEVVLRSRAHAGARRRTAQLPRTGRFVLLDGVRVWSAAASSRWRAIPTSGPCSPSSRPISTQVEHRVRRDGARGAQRPCGRRAVVHRPLRRRQVDAGDRGRAAPVPEGLPGLCARRRQCAARPERQSRLLARGPRREHPPRRRGRGAVRRRRHHLPHGLHLALSRRPRPGARRRAATHFHEIYIKAGLAACERRDPKGLYKKARAARSRLHRHLGAL